jgi:hypothetical protein
LGLFYDASFGWNPEHTKSCGLRLGADVRLRFGKRPRTRRCEQHSGRQGNSQNQQPVQDSIGFLAGNDEKAGRQNPHSQREAFSIKERVI